MKRLRRLAALVLMAMTMVMAGCAEQLYGDLSEQEANDVTSALQMEGISASKKHIKDKRWGVMVSSTDFAAAVAVLRERNMPVFAYEGLGKTFKKDSLLITPTEERARLMHAFSQELTQTLRQLDGVLAARVHIVVPATDALSDKPKPSAAAVFLKVREGVDLREQVGQIKQLVANGAEGLSPEQVSVLLTTGNVVRREPQRPTTSWEVWAAMALTAVGILGLILYGNRRRLVAGWELAAAKLRPKQRA